MEIAISLVIAVVLAIRCRYWDGFSSFLVNEIPGSIFVAVIGFGIVLFYIRKFSGKKK